MTLFIVLTVVEILLLVIVLSIYLTVVERGLRSISNTCGKIAFGVRAVESQVSVIGPGVRQLNQLLAELADNLLPVVAERAEAIAGE